VEAPNADALEQKNNELINERQLRETADRQLAATRQEMQRLESVQQTQGVYPKFFGPISTLNAFSALSGVGIKAADQGIPIFIGSSAESVGGFWLRQFAKSVI
jgi:hypothetical protein